MAVKNIKTYNGFVGEKLLNKGSKSEHNAIVLDTGEGNVFKLRLADGNPFRDPALEKFIGKRVSVRAAVSPDRPHVLIVDGVSDITVVDVPARPSPQRPPSPKPR